MDSFTEYVTAQGPRLLRSAFVMCGDRHLAEDLVQSALIRLHGRWSRVESAGSPDAYVRQCVVNEFLSWRRRLRNRELAVGDLPEGPGVADSAGRLAERDEMWRRLGGLRRSQRVALALRFYEDLDYSEIGVAMGCKATTARVHVSQGLAALRLRWDEESVSALALGGGVA